MKKTNQITQVIIVVILLFTVSGSFAIGNQKHYFTTGNSDIFQPSGKNYRSMIVTEFISKDKNMKIFGIFLFNERYNDLGQKYNGQVSGFLIYGPKGLYDKISKSIAAQIDGKMTAQDVKARLDNMVTQLSSSFHVGGLNASAIQNLLGKISIVDKSSYAKDGSSMDETTSNVIKTIAGAGGTSTAVGWVGGGTLSVSVIAGSGAAGLGIVLSSVGAVGALSYCGGKLVDQVTSAVISYATDGSETSAGGLAASLVNYNEEHPSSNPNSGASGANGSTGATGASGANGANGATGASGATGATGASGATGATGASGSDGASSATGATGVSGADGATGASGATGPSGEENPQNDGPGTPPNILLGVNAATGLFKNEVRRFGNTLHMAAGAGVDGTKDFMDINALLTFDAAMGGFYLKSVIRNIEAIKNKNGIIEKTMLTGSLKMLFSGVTDPPSVFQKVNTTAIIAK